MPCERQWVRHGVVSRCWGDVAAWEFLQSIEAITADERFDDLRYIIVDCLDACSLSIDDGTREDITALCVGAQCTNPNIQMLIVSDNPLFVRLLHSVMEALPEKTGLVKVFRSPQQARNWLELGIRRNEFVSKTGD